MTLKDLTLNLNQYTQGLLTRLDPRDSQIDSQLGSRKLPNSPDIISVRSSFTDLRWVGGWWIGVILLRWTKHIWHFQKDFIMQHNINVLTLRHLVPSGENLVIYLGHKKQKKIIWFFYLPMVFSSRISLFLLPPNQPNHPPDEVLPFSFFFAPSFFTCKTDKIQLRQQLIYTR